jgi:hypothetical protein
VNFYRRFLPSIARTLRPLTDALRGGRKGADRLEWSAAMDAAFAAAKQSLLPATHLALPTVGAELSVVVDASATHKGRACSSDYLARRRGNPWVSSQRSWRRPSRNIPPSTGSYLPVLPGYVTSGTCWTAGGSPSSRTTSHSPMPWLGCLNRGRHARPGSCPTWRSILRTSAISPGQATWWRIPSPGRLGTRRQRGLPRRRPV